MSEPHHLGVFIPTGEAGTIDHTVDVVTRYQEAGFSSVWFPQSTGPDPLVAAAAVGRHVPSIEFGTAVIPIYPRHPAALAASARTAQDALGGRLRLGIGVSHKIAMEDRYHLPYLRPAAYMEEYLRVLSPLLAGEKANVDGEMVGATIRITDQAPSGCPLYLAALQPRMLRLAGAVADGTITWCCGLVTVRDHIVPEIRQAAAERFFEAGATTFVAPCGDATDQKRTIDALFA